MSDLDDLLSGQQPETDSETTDKDELTIAAVLRHYGATRIPSGYGWKSMRCPFKQFHADSRASASVNRGTNKFRCHACGTGGNPIDIIKKLEGLNYREASEQARTIFGTSGESVSRSTAKHFKRPAQDSARWKEILD